MSRPVELRGGQVLVTGAGSGIGRATACAFAEQGAAVVCADIDGSAAEKTAAIVAERGVAGTPYAVDVADRDAMLALARTVHAEHGPLDVLVNNAGVGLSGPFLSVPLPDWDWIVGINLLGVVHGCHAFVPAMLERGRGHVVNLSSGLAYTPRATESAYITTKAAVLALSRCLRADWHGQGVGVTAVCPGVIDTAIIRHARFRGGRADPGAVEDVRRFFAQRGHPPELVATAIVNAVRRDRPVVPVGIEARIGWYLNRLLPLRAGDWLARLSAGGI